MPKACERCGVNVADQVCPSCEALVCEPCLEGVPEGCPLCWTELSGTSDE